MYVVELVQGRNMYAVVERATGEIIGLHSTMGDALRVCRRLNRRAAKVRVLA